MRNIGQLINSTVLNGATGIKIHRNVAYVASYFSDSFAAIDISDPANPVLLDHLAGTRLNGANDVEIVGDFALVPAEVDGSIQVIDISNPADLRFVGEVQDSALTNVHRVIANGRYVYALTFSATSLVVLELPTLTSPSAEFGTMVAQNITSDELVTNYLLTANQDLNVGNNALVNGLLSITGNSSTTLGTNLAQLTLGGATVRDSFMTFQNGANDWSIGLENADSSFRIGSSSSLGTNDYLTIDVDGNIGIGTTSPASKLSLDTSANSLDGAGVAALDQYILTENTSNGAVQFGNRFFLNASNTATTTIVGSVYRVQDDTTFGNTVRGLEVQTNRGGNTQGENTALSGFARTFGVRGVTSGDAGGSFEPAGGFFETEGTTQGNAIRGFSDSITTATLLSLFQSSSTFAGTGLQMNFGNGGGSFASTSSKYLDFQNGGTSVFTVSAFGTTTIGDGTTNNQAGLQIGFGGLCVDDDGSCTASTTGRITAVELQSANSDLAETYFSSQALEPGELVSLYGELSVRRADPNSTLPVLGVVSTNPGFTLGSDDTSTRSGESAYPIALTGRVPVILSTENGDIKQGDQLMLSSIPGVAMKATGTGAVIGLALEDFDTTRYYSTTYLNQFGDSLVEPQNEPINTNDDPRIDDNCYYSGGTAVGEPECVPLSATTSAGQLQEANDLAEQESIEEQLRELARVRAETRTTPAGETVQVGQVVMFVERSYRWLDTEMAAAIEDVMTADAIGLRELMATTAEEEGATMGMMATVIDAVTTLWHRVTGLEERLEDLEAENRALEQRLQQLEQQTSGEAPAPERPAEEEPAADLAPADQPAPSDAPTTDPATTTPSTTAEVSEEGAVTTPPEMPATTTPDMNEPTITEESVITPEPVAEAEPEIEEEVVAEPVSEPAIEEEPELVTEPTIEEDPATEPMPDPTPVEEEPTAAAN
jgi:hypothetical protein